jgi:hypothetical protein
MDVCATIIRHKGNFRLQKISIGCSLRKILILSWNWNTCLRSQAFDMGNVRHDMNSVCLHICRTKTI